MTPEDIRRYNESQKNKKDKFCTKCQRTFKDVNYTKCPLCNSDLYDIDKIPHCPTCQSSKIKKISDLSRTAHAVLFGVVSKTARSQFECLNCGYKW